MTEKFYKQDEAKTALVNLRTRKKIFHVVLITHIVIISMILVWGLAVEFFKPKRPKSITVSLYTPPVNPGPPAYTPPKTKTKPKAATKKTPKKKVIKKPKKKWKAAKKIKVSRDLVYVKPVKTRPRIKPMDKQKLLNYLKQNRVKIRSNTSIAQSYENSVGAYLYQLWDTPDKSLLNGKHPEVKIQLNIAANGKLLNARILKPSGITAMDKSVQKLLQKVKYLPAPSNGAKKITLILEVIE
jgi:TonB family protein